MTSTWFFLSTLNYDARSTTHQIYNLIVSLQSCNRTRKLCDVQTGSDSVMTFLAKFRPYTWLRIMSVSLFSLGKLMAVKYHALCAKFSHERDLWKSRFREGQWSTWRLLLISWMRLRTACSWVINIWDKLTVSIFYAAQGRMQFHRNIGKCLPLFMDFSALEIETAGLSKRRIPTILWCFGKFQKDGDF